MIEDAPAGIKAAKAAGMSAIAVVTTHDEAALAGADAIADSLDAIPLTWANNSFAVTNADSTLIVRA